MTRYPIVRGCAAFVFVLGGLSLVGPPLLLLTARRRRWGAGPIPLVCAGDCGLAALAAGVYHRVAAAPGPRPSMSAVCFFYGTPPMALYVTLTLLAGGHLRRSRGAGCAARGRRRSGLLLGLAWACTGLYIISLFYRQDFSGK